MALFETKSAPWLSKISVTAMIEFKRMYERYARELAIAAPPGSDPVVPYKMVDCVDEKLLSTICLFGGFPNTEDEPTPTLETMTDAQLLHFIDTEVSLPYTMQTSVVSLDDLGKKHLKYNMSLPVRARVYDLFTSWQEMVTNENLAARLKGKKLEEDWQAVDSSSEACCLETECGRVLYRVDGVGAPI